MAPSAAIRAGLSLLNTSQSTTCAPSSAFVTLVANESYVHGAVCLQTSLRRVHSACPLILVVADPLPAEAMTQLSAAFTDVIQLSELRQRLDRYEQRQLARKTQAEHEANAFGGARRLAAVKAQAPIRSTRQLTRAGGWARRTHQKLLLFALKGYRKAAFLDIDMLILRNIDALLEQPAFSAVAALPYTTSSFNSGVFVFEPSLPTAAVLDDLSQRATFKPVGHAVAGGTSQIRIRGYGERFALSDQSILNHHYRGVWRPLPFGYNLGVKVRQVNPKLWHQVELAVVHYVHRPKPWEASLADADSPMSLLTRKLGIDGLVRAWRWRCGISGEARWNVSRTAEEQALWGT